MGIENYYIKTSRKNRTVISGYENFRGICGFGPGVEMIENESFIKVAPPFWSKGVEKIVENIEARIRRNDFRKGIEPILLSAPELDFGIPENGQETDILKHQFTDNQNSEKLLEEALHKGRKVVQFYAEELESSLNLTKKPDFLLMKIIGDIIISDNFHNPASPLIDIKSDLGTYLLNMNSVGHLIKYIDEDYLKRSIEKPVKEIIWLLKSKASGKKKNRLKFVHLSMHDTDLSPLLVYFGIIDIECNLRQISSIQNLNCEYKPAFSSSLIFELVKRPSGQFFVFTRFNGRYIDVCSRKTPPPKKRAPCSLPRFVSRLSRGIWEKQCQGQC